MFIKNKLSTKIIAKGKKLFITNGMIADYIILYGRKDKINRTSLSEEVKQELEKYDKVDFTDYEKYAILTEPAEAVVEPVDGSRRLGFKVFFSLLG